MLDLLREERLTTEQLGFAETAYSSAEALLTVINDVLDFSKIEAGKLTLENIDSSRFRSSRKCAVYSRSGRMSNI